MKTVKNLMLILLLTALVIPVSGYAAEAPWTDNFDQAKAQAKKENKYILMAFSGSDWCHWCIKLDKEVFSTKEFLDFAKDNLVLMSADFPRRSAQAEEIRQQNERLARMYHVRGFPTVAILNPDAALVTITGYRPGGGAAYVEYLKKVMHKQ